VSSELYSQYVNLTVQMALNSAEWRNRIDADSRVRKLETNSVTI